ncbi:unnamed protein product [Pedinophyceae sp. YPF-701]|nr:unnamed protein product [Pedinophyceae sp. YPF-701]
MKKEAKKQGQKVGQSTLPSSEDVENFLNTIFQPAVVLPVAFVVAGVIGLAAYMGKISQWQASLALLLMTLLIRLVVTAPAT